MLILATTGGLVSFLSTSTGALFSRAFTRNAASNRWSLSIDFALGLMVSASAFSLIGPAAFGAQASGHSVMSILIVALLGMAFVGVLKMGIVKFQASRHSGESAEVRTAARLRTSHFLLASVLMLHNFPEGLASGAALGGLGWSGSWPILLGISLQNIPEGALMVICLRALGWSEKKSFLGGIASGGVELTSGILSGLLLSSVTGVLPLLLSFAGGAMITSVLSELTEGDGKLIGRVFSRQFATGFAFLPLIQIFSI